jgi:hypothetical protein
MSLLEIGESGNHNNVLTFIRNLFTSFFTPKDGLIWELNAKKLNVRKLIPCEELLTAWCRLRNKKHRKTEPTSQETVQGS